MGHGTWDIWAREVKANDKNLIPPNPKRGFCTLHVLNPLEHLGFCFKKGLGFWGTSLHFP